MKNKYFYPIYKLKIKSWIKYWLIKQTEFKGVLSDILEGISFYLTDSLNMKFKMFKIYGRTTQESTSGKNKLNCANPLAVTGSVNIPCDLPAGSYTISCSKAETTGTTNYMVQIQYEDSTNAYFSIYREALTGTLTLTKRATNIRLYSQDGYDHSQGVTTTFYDLMIRDSSITDATYEPYTGGEPAPNPKYPFPIKNTGDNGSVNEKVSNSDGTQEQNISFSLAQGQKLYQDEELKENGKDDIWREKILDGTEDWQYVNGQFVIYGTNYLKYSDGGKCYSSHFIGSAIDNLINVNLHMWIGNNTFILCQYDDITSLEDWKTFLAEQYANGTPVTVVYKKAEPTITPYTEEQQQYYDEHIKPLRTYKNVTHISSEDETPAKLKIQYWKEG